MTPITPKPIRHLLVTGLIPLMLGLWGCGAAPPRETPPVEPPVEVKPVDTNKAALELPPSQYAEVFARAEQNVQAFDWMSAETALAELPAQELALVDADYLVYLQARIAFVRGDLTQALGTLRLLEYSGVHPGLRYRALNLHRHLESLAGNDLVSARLGEQLLVMAPLSEQANLRRDIWRDLQRAKDRDLRNARAGETDPLRRGWLELALAVRGEDAGPEEVELWRDSNPQHPAAQPLPGGINYLLDSPTQAQRVCLLLPLSGRLAMAGKAVRDGYLAQYYAARSLGMADFELHIIDQDGFPSANAAYDEAVLQGADLVVGPLGKQSVAQLIGRPDRSIPVIALNRSTAINPGTGAPLVQLSLSPEDEAARLAEFAFGQGARRALIIRPATNWGDKVEKTLLQRWQLLGGSLADSNAYGERVDHPDSVKEALDIPASERRARGVRDMLATNIEFTARRRQDVDTIFLLAANGPEARSLKPLLAFHYAGNIPVYSTSSIYSGLPNERDRDLNGINLVEIPWLLGASPSLRVAIAAGDTGSGAYTRLNALGADALLLQQNFSTLQAGPDVLLRGNTGLLTMDPGQHMVRDTSLATFDGGELQPR
jgi:hypothetical protein